MISKNNLLENIRFEVEVGNKRIHSLDVDKTVGKPKYVFGTNRK